MQKLYKPKWVIFEGPDRAGKTTLIGILYRIRQHNDFFQDRGLLSTALYNPPAQGEQYHIDMLRAWLNLETSRLVVLMIDYETHVKRSRLTDHPIDTAEDYAEISSFFKRHGEVLQDEFPDKVLIVDARKPQAEVIDTVNRFLALDEDDLLEQAVPSEECNV